MRGGLGDNIYIVNDPNDRITAYGGRSYDKVISSISWTIDTASGIEDLLLTGKALHGIGNQKDNKIQGNQNDNLIDGGNGSDTLLGSSGSDTILGGRNNDVIVGGSGDDVLDGGSGFDTVRQRGDVNFTLTNLALTGIGEDTITNIEKIVLVGGANDNVIDARRFTKGSVSLSGNNSIEESSCSFSLK